MNHDFELLGQKFNYPKTWHGALCILQLLPGSLALSGSQEVRHLTNLEHSLLCFMSTPGN